MVVLLNCTCQDFRLLNVSCIYDCDTFEFLKRRDFCPPLVGRSLILKMSLIALKVRLVLFLDLARMMMVL